MSQALSIAVREQIYALQRSGVTPTLISKSLEIPIGTVKQLYRRFRVLGEAGLVPCYENCGQKTSLRYKEEKSKFLSLKQAHPSWGAPRLHLEQSLTAADLKGEQDGLVSQEQVATPSIRSLNRWYRQAGLTKSRKQTGEKPIGRSKAAHNIWEIDAKERLILEDGSPGCYLTITDEKTGAWLEAPVFPPIIASVKYRLRKFKKYW